MPRNEYFEGIRDAMLEFLDDLRKGRPLTVREVEVRDRPKPMSARQIVALRRNKLQVSQGMFAELLNTATQTVQAWEQGRNRPSGLALRFLRVIDRHPEVLGEMIAGKPKIARARAGRKNSRVRRKAS